MHIEPVFADCFFPRRSSQSVKTSNQTENVNNSLIEGLELANSK